jgi:hypothetical protein
MIHSDPQKILTDAMYHVKRAFEDKELESLKDAFTPNARLNADGKFFTVAQMVASIKILFEHVDQTYFDVLDLKQSEVNEQGYFGVFEVSVSWVNRSNWQETTQRLQLSIEVTRDDKQPANRISGLTAGRLPDAKPADPQGHDGAGVPVEVLFGTPARGGFDPFSFWY